MICCECGETTITVPAGARSDEWQYCPECDRDYLDGLGLDEDGVTW